MLDLLPDGHDCPACSKKCPCKARPRLALHGKAARPATIQPAMASPPEGTDLPGAFESRTTPARTAPPRPTRHTAPPATPACPDNARPGLCRECAKRRTRLSSQRPRVPRTRTRHTPEACVPVGHACAACNREGGACAYGTCAYGTPVFAAPVPVIPAPGTLMPGDACAACTCGACAVGACTCGACAVGACTCGACAVGAPEGPVSVRARP